MNEQPPVVTEDPAVAALRQHITEYLDKEPGLLYERDSDGRFVVTHGSARVFIRPYLWEIPAQEIRFTCVHIFSPVASDIDTTAAEAMASFLAEENRKQMFGKFSLDLPQATVWFEHVLLGDFLDREELIVVVALVTKVADQYDDHIAQATRGKRAID
jgi:hypothetical protein